MKFVCDSCGAQYMIADEKVGPKGVKVRCKKCSHVIVVRPAPADAEADATVVMSNPLAGEGASPDAGAAFSDPAADAEIGAAFDSIFGEDGGLEGAGDGEGGADLPAAAAQADPFTSDVDDAFAAAMNGPSAAAGDDDDDRAATRVFTSADIKRVAQERERATQDVQFPSAGGSAAYEAAFEPEPEPPAADEPPTDDEWYVAIGDEQVGPLTVDEVQDRWEAGDLSPDSLVWRAGMDDWVPLSTVEPLKHLIAPTPAAPRPAVEPEGPAPRRAEPEASAAPAPTEDDAPEWKPAAASLLASLAAEEMDALDKQASEPALAAPSQDPVGRALDEDLPPPAAEAPSSGLDLDLPPPPAEAPDEPSQAAPAPASEAPAAASAAPSSTAPSSTAAEARPRPAPAFQEPTRPVTTAAAAGGGGWLTPGRLVAVVGGAAGFVVLLVFGSLWAAGVFDKDVPDATTVASAAPSSAEAASSEAVAPKAEAAKAEAPAPEPKKSEAVAAAEPAEDAAAKNGKAGTDGESGTQAKAKAEAASADGTKGSKPAAAPAKPAPKETKVAKADPPRKKVRHRPRRHTRRARARHRDPSPPARTAPAKKASADDDLLAEDSDLEEALFGSSSPKPRTARKPAARASKPSAGYIPPAPGTGGDLPKSLSQSAILQVVASNKRSLRSCVEKQQASEPSLHGKIVMSWRIRPDGKASGVSCVTPEFAGSVMCTCMKGTIGRMRFPRYGGPQMQAINFPFSF